MYYRSGTVDATPYVPGRHAPGGSTFLREMSWPPSWKWRSQIWPIEWMHIYVKNIPVKFHPDPI